MPPENLAELLRIVVIPSGAPGAGGAGGAGARWGIV